MDRNLKKKEVRKEIRGVSAIEKSLKKKKEEEVTGGDDADLAVAFRLPPSSRSILTYPSTVPMNWGGMLVFQRLRALLDQMLQRMLSLRNDRELARLVRVTSRWKDLLLPLYRKVSRLVRYAKGALCNTRVPGLGRRWSRREAEGIPARGRGESSEERRARRYRLQEHGEKILWRATGDGLFHCYRDSRIPRTNNGLEITIRRVEMSYRRMSGRKSWDDFIASYGRSVFMIPSDTSREGLLELAERADRRAPSSNAGERVPRKALSHQYDAQGRYRLSWISPGAGEGLG